MGNSNVFLVSILWCARFGDSKKFSDRIQRLSVKKSDEWKYSGLATSLFAVNKVQRLDATTTTVQRSEPSLRVSCGLADHQNPDTAEARQPVVLLFAYRDRKSPLPQHDETFGKVAPNCVQDMEFCMCTL